MGSEKTKAGGPAKPELPATSYADKLEAYTPERIAEFLLNNAVNAADYARGTGRGPKDGTRPGHDSA